MDTSTTLPRPAVNPIESAAAALLKLHNATNSPRPSQDRMEHGLADEARCVGAGLLAGLEAMLVVQAQTLHAIFTHATERYADGAEDEKKAKLFSAIAFKAQSYCRQTVAVLARMKKAIEYKGRFSWNSQKSWNELSPFKIDSTPEPQHEKAPEERPKGATAEDWIRHLKEQAG